MQWQEASSFYDKLLPTEIAGVAEIQKLMNWQQVLFYGVDCVHLIKLGSKTAMPNCIMGGRGSLLMGAQTQLNTKQRRRQRTLQWLDGRGGNPLQAICHYGLGF
jgi:hypothetical protein